MVGLVTETEALVWLAGEGRARLRYWPASRPEARRTTRSIDLGNSPSGIAKFRLEGLERDRRYAGVVIVDGRQRDRFAFRTAPRRGAEPELVIATGSCAYLHDPETDRGPSYGGDPRIFRAIAAERPDLMFWLGDNVYYRDADLESEALMRRRQLRPRLNDDVRALLRRCANLAIWDDHDYGPNDSDGSFARKSLSLEIFTDFWANPPMGTTTTPGVFFRHRLGDLEFFATDGRYHRSPNAMADGPAKTMLGREQLDWLVAALAESDATFKVVVFGNQVLNPICRFEGMELYAHERGRLLDAIAARGISGVIFLSGDRHHSEIIRRERAGTYPLLDLTVSPLLSGTYGDDERRNPARLPGSYLTDVRNFALLRLLGRGPERRIEIEFRDLDGRLLFGTRVRARELR